MMLLAVLPHRTLCVECLGADTRWRQAVSGIRLNVWFTETHTLGVCF